jgi:molybdopterin/thiamine biosynthesis adenylyltransferase/ubiquitin-protein ligase
VWWHRYPGRLAREVEQLKSRGFGTTFDPSLVERDVVEIKATYSRGGREYRLRIVFPHLYPYFRPQVFVNDFFVPHHQNPFDGNLCLLGRNSDNWDPTFLAADVIEEQLPKLFESESIASAGGEPDEELQAEPWTEYLSPNSEFRIAWNSEIEVPEGSSGKVELKYGAQSDVFRAYVNRIRTAGESDLFTETRSIVPDAKARMWVSYIRLVAAPPRDLNEIIPLAKQRLQNYQPQGLIKRLTTRTRGTLLALFYPEETEYRRAGVGLVFVLFTNNANGLSLQYIKAYRDDVSTIAARLGNYGDIRDKRMLLVGFGSLGSSVAVGLCKLGVRQLTIVDRDAFEPGNATRHFLGMNYFGMEKGDAAADALRKAYPYTTVTQILYRLGDFGPETIGRNNEFLAALEDSDLVVDCSAERGVQHFLSDSTRTSKKQYVFVEGYPGMLGGFIGFLDPQVGPCFLCFLRSLQVGSTRFPPILQNGMIQPAGCGEPTFIGTGFDADTMGCATVRLIFAALAGGIYPKPSSSYYRVAFASAERGSSEVVVESINIAKTIDCAVCGNP